jgi:hypothetical protein
MKLLVVSEKHGDHYYTVEADKDLHDICCVILKRRLDEGWYGSEQDLISFQERYGNVEIQEKIAEQLEGQLKRDAERTIKYMRNQEKELLNTAEFRDSIKAVIEQGFVDHEKRAISQYAWGLLSSRSDYEYESVELTHAQTAEELKKSIEED